MKRSNTTPNGELLPSLWSDLLNGERFFSSRWPMLDPEFTIPAANVIENGKAFRIELAVPGFSKDDFTIDVDDNLLSIYAEKQEEKNEEKERYTRKEFAYKSFSRSFTLPQNIDDAKIEAGYADGILNLTIPKKETTKDHPKKAIRVN